MEKLTCESSLSLTRAPFFVSVCGRESRSYVLTIGSVVVVVDDDDEVVVDVVVVEEEEEEGLFENKVKKKVARGAARATTSILS